MRENEKQWELLQASLKNFNNEKTRYNVLSEAFDNQTSLQITKLTKAITITGGKIGKKSKK